MSTIQKNLKTVQERIRNACLKRAVNLSNIEPRLVAVSKTKPIESIIEAYNCGQRHFGENYVQEIWHFIGHLQRNKVNKLLSIPNLFAVETVDSEKLADALNNYFSKTEDENKKINIFIQVNTSGEESKSGCKPNETCNLVKHIIDNCKHLNVMGLMTIGKYDNYLTSQDKIDPDFQCLIDCKDNICKNLNVTFDQFELSMGMSADFERAILAGSSNVRVGSLIFGGRS
ncbi:predicted protein [Pediculus humanus corporis]|uniref:Pyridoxal phosphate homeostasis protein n=1 Tax=Pediculus humanus subsp. corporis TaxID=121224 RepID=E0VIK8_PEDHC|nr:uncharacterized protein Phum_PHUM228710 [Pediculus humanus corporis]EEB13214.1 predicted protein [Pediculus humanus corporis]